jgi:hypothetical protein
LLSSSLKFSISFKQVTWKIIWELETLSPENLVLIQIFKSLIQNIEAGSGSWTSGSKSKSRKIETVSLGFVEVKWVLKLPNEITDFSQGKYDFSP